MNDIENKNGLVDQSLDETGNNNQNYDIEEKPHNQDDGIEIVYEPDEEEKPSDQIEHEIDKQKNNRKNKKKKNKLKKALLIIGGMILTFIVVLAATLIIMRITGKSSLYNKASSTKPNLLREDIVDGTEDDEYDINPDDLNDVNNSEKPSGTTSDANNSDKKETYENKIIPAESGENYDVIFNGQKYVYNEDMITLLILGIDSIEPVQQAKDGISGGQSDAIFLLVMNPHTMVMDIIAIPRDTITKLWIYDEEGNFVQTGKAQICLQHGYGDGMSLSNERALKAVSYLMYDVPIHSVSSLNMGAVAMLNDSIGGVTLSSIETFDYNGFSYVKGQQVNLMGNMAYEYVHYRDKTRHNTASERLARQKQYISAFLNKAISAAKKDLGIVTDIYDIISKYLVTDLDLDEIVYLASEAISYEFGEIYTLQGTLDTSRQYERYYLDEDALQQLIIDKFYEKVK